MVIPNVNSIYSNAFQDCTNLKKIIIPKTVIFLGDEVFINCTNLQMVTYFGYKCPVYGESVFYGTDTNVAYVPTGYEDKNFSGLPIIYIPTELFTMSSKFSESSIFTQSNKFKSKIFT